MPFLNFPVWEKKCGKNKTWRGIVVATIAGGLVFWLQQLAYSSGFTKLAIIDYTGFPLIFGFLLGFGAIIGDLIESYYKRKAGVAPGKPWFPFDQLDFVIGGLFFGFFVYVPKANLILVLLIVSPLLHIIFNRIGYWLKINKTKW